ncbi:hypothetical protein V6N13_028230 [Hibiscus sabdariffa]
MTAAGEVAGVSNGGGDDMERGIWDFPPGVADPDPDQHRPSPRKKVLPDPAEYLHCTRQQFIFNRGPE